MLPRDQKNIAHVAKSSVKFSNRCTTPAGTKNASPAEHEVPFAGDN